MTVTANKKLNKKQSNAFGWCHISVCKVSLWFLVAQCTDTRDATLLGDGGSEHVVSLLLPTRDAPPQLTLEAPRTANVQLLVPLLENDLQIGTSLYHTPVHL